MSSKIDLVMWTKNGANSLPLVLKRIPEVIPAEFTDKRIVVDDQSADETPEIARQFGWTVIPNEGKGISDGANTALRHVESERFISFEQDLILAYNWWSKIPEQLRDEKVAAASGTRLPSGPTALRKTEEFALERYQRRTDSEAFFIGKTLDNTIYKTRIIREIGGFPNLPIPAGVDNVLAHRLREKGYEWKVDYSVKSIHLRKGLREELRHYYWYGTCFNVLVPFLSKQNLAIKPMILRLLLSPLRGLDVAIRKNAPGAIIIYPLTRLAVFRGVVAGRKDQSCSF